MSRPVFLFCHPPKTGGTSITDFAKQIFGEQGVALQKQPGDLTFLNDFEGKVDDGVRFFSGHVGLPTLVSIRHQHPRLQVVICIAIREPVDHFLSAFYHAAAFLPELAVARGNPEPAEVLTTYADGDPFDVCCINLLSRYLLLDQPAGPLPKAAHDLIPLALESVDFVFDCDDLGASTTDFVARFDLNGSGVVRRLNTNPLSQATIDRATLPLRVIAEVCDPDRRAWRIAKSRCTTESKLVRVGASRPPVPLAEVMRRRPERLSTKIVDSAYFEFRNNAILLHPPPEGRSQVIATDIWSTDSFGCEVTSTARLDPRAHAAVWFEMLCEVDTDYSVMVRKLVPPGVEHTFSVPVPSGRLTVSLATEVQLKGSHAFAWAVFDEIELRAGPDHPTSTGY